LDDRSLFAAQGAFLMSAICPECDSPIDVDEYDVDVGDELTCSECGSLLRVSSDSPLELELADEDDDLDDEDEDDDRDEEEDEDEDLDEDVDDDEDDDRIDEDE
jgi:alpha-aminoadipate carrier protein LysW